MKKFIAPAACFVLVCTLIFAALLLTGCGKGEDTATGFPSGGPSPAPMPQPSAPAGTPSAQPGPPSPTGPVGPSSQPTAPTPGAAATSAAKPGTAAVLPGGKITFEQVEKKSNVARITDKDTGMVYLRFQYKDWADNTCLCEVPEGITKEARTPEAWLSTFEIYKKEITKKATNKKPTRLNDFPFVRRK
jgi:hypothetical protein